jgi:hypothetical protein
MSISSLPVLSIMNAADFFDTAFATAFVFGLPDASESDDVDDDDELEEEEEEEEAEEADEE